MIDETLLNKLYKGPNTVVKIASQLQEGVVTYTPIVTQLDVQNGYITRYFARKSNDAYSTQEIDLTQYENLAVNPRFLCAKIKWKIVGPKESTVNKYGAKVFGVNDINLKTTKDADLTFGGLKYYIGDYLQFWVAEA